MNNACKSPGVPPEKGRRTPDEHSPKPRSGLITAARFARIVVVDAGRRLPIGGLAGGPRSRSGPSG